MQTPSSLGNFSKTRFRFVCRESRALFHQLSPRLGLQSETSGFLYLLLDDAVLRHNADHLGAFLCGNTRDVVSLYALLQHVKTLPPTRENASRFDLTVHGQTWEFLTTNLFVIDYSFDELVRMAHLFSCYSPSVIYTAVKKTEPGKNLTYIRAICDRLRAETVPTERKEELYDQRIAKSLPVTVPQYRNPGFVSAALAEDELFDWLEGSRAL